VKDLHGIVQAQPLTWMLQTKPVEHAMPVHGNERPAQPTSVSPSRVWDNSEALFSSAWQTREPLLLRRYGSSCTVPG
jgi:hypothetical protein